MFVSFEDMTCEDVGAWLKSLHSAPAMQAMSGTTGADLAVLADDFEDFTRDMSFNKLQLMAMKNALNRLKETGWCTPETESHNPVNIQSVNVNAEGVHHVNQRDVYVNCNLTGKRVYPVDQTKAAKFAELLEAYNRANAIRVEATLVHDDSGYRVYCKMCPNTFGVKITGSTFTNSSIDPFLKTHVAGSDHQTSARKFLGMPAKLTTTTKPARVDEVTDMEVKALCAANTTWKETNDKRLLHTPCGFHLQLKSSESAHKNTKKRLEHNMTQHIRACDTALENKRKKPKPKKRLNKKLPGHDSQLITSQFKLLPKEPGEIKANAEETNAPINSANSTAKQPAQPGKTKEFIQSDSLKNASSSSKHSEATTNKGPDGLQKKSDSLNFPAAEVSETVMGARGQDRQKHGRTGKRKSPLQGKSTKKTKHGTYG